MRNGINRQTLRVAALVVGLIGARGLAASMDLDGYVATVNDRVITVGDIMLASEPVNDQIRLNYGGDELTRRLRESYQRALDQLIERDLIIEEAKRRELLTKIPDRAVEEYINNLVHERFDDNRARFLAVLTDQRTTMAEYHEQIRESLAVMELRRQEVSRRVVISPTAIRAAYDQNLDKYRTAEMVKARVIVLHQGKTLQEQEAKRQQADNVRARIVKGESFAAVAKAVSEGPKAAEGGELGWYKPGDMRPELRVVLMRLAPNEVSEVIPVENDLYLVAVEGRKEASTRTFDEVRPQIEKELMYAEEDRMGEEWVTKLKQRHYVRMLRDAPPF